MSVVSVYINFVEHRIFGTILCASEVLNPSVIIWLLVQELIARECEDFESLFTVLGVEVSHPSIVRGGQTSKACNVSDKCQLFVSCVNSNFRQGILSYIDGRNRVERVIFSIGISI